ncbi:hypothetical protein T484DRAFT_1611240, partial [Baffinella frigidus]
RNLTPGTRNQKPETMIPKPETQDPKPAIRNPNPETRNPKPETRMRNYVKQLSALTALSDSIGVRGEPGSAPVANVPTPYLGVLDDSSVF